MKFTDMYGYEATIVTVSFKEYRRVKDDPTMGRIYRVGSGECMFWVWQGVHYANKREAHLNYATEVTNLQAYLDKKISLI